MSGEIFRKCLNLKQTNSLHNWLCPQPRLASEAKRKPSFLIFAGIRKDAASANSEHMLMKSISDGQSCDVLHF